MADGRCRFLIVSNLRSGSTWLETMLGALPDVFTDFEFKWAPVYPPSPIHYVLNANSPSVGTCLDGLRQEPGMVIGSKLVLDPVPFTDQDKVALRGLFSPDLRIVHLTRNYGEVLISRMRGVAHLLNPHGPAVEGQALAQTLRASTGAFQRACVPTPRTVSPEACRVELERYLDNDLWAKSLRDTCARYTLVDYRQIGSRFEDIARFVGSRAHTAVVQAVVDCPPTVKLPTIADRSLAPNRDALEPLFSEFDKLRGRLILGQLRESRLVSTISSRDAMSGS